MALTKEQIASKTEELKAFIAAHKDIDGPLMPIMQHAQESFSYLSMETMTLIADSLGIPVADVYGIATFYAQFSLKPKGDYVVSVCQGTACYVKGAAAVLEEVKSRLAPVMVVNGDVYGRRVPADIKGILEKYDA